MENENNKVIMEQRTDRTLRIKFDGDFEYLHFIKILATSPHTQNVPLLKVFFEQNFDRILNDDELSEMYNQIK